MKQTAFILQPSSFTLGPRRATSPPRVHRSAQPVRLPAGSGLEPAIPDRRCDYGGRLLRAPEAGLAPFRPYLVPAQVPPLHGLPVAARACRRLPAQPQPAAGL